MLKRRNRTLDRIKIITFSGLILNRDPKHKKNKQSYI